MLTNCCMSFAYKAEVKFTFSKEQNCLYLLVLMYIVHLLDVE